MLEAIQNWVVQTGLMVSLLIVIILMIRRPFARMFGANAAYALWSLPVIRVFLPGFSIPEGWLPSRFRPEPVPLPSQQGFEVLPEIAISPSNPPALAFTPETAAQGTLALGSILITIWICIAAFWLIYQLYQQVRFKTRLVGESSVPNQILNNEITDAVDSVGLRKSPEVRVSTLGLGPLVTGVVNPLVILPQDFEQRFDKQQRHFALVHEFAHIKRCDLVHSRFTVLAGFP